jgi:pimeloyl-CoA synthetase
MEHQRAKSECPSRNLLKKRRKLSERLIDLGD